MLRRLVSHHVFSCSSLSLAVTDWAITEVMIDLFGSEVVPSKMFTLTKLQMMLSLASGGGVLISPEDDDADDLRSDSLTGTAIDENELEWLR
jgi:hypothetical protein